MMKINTNSWHYKAADCFMKEVRPSESLCLYFWQVLGGCFAIVACCAIIVAFAAFAVSPILMLIINDLAFIGCIASFLWIIGLSCYLIKKVADDTSDVTFVRVTVNFISAKKRKICPHLEFIDKE